MTDELAPIPDEKEIAFEVWAFIAGRNAAETARILKGEPGPMEQWERPVYPNISDRTIRDWVSRYHWHERAEKQLRDLAPGIHAQIKQEITLSTVESMDYLRKVVRGEVTGDKVRANVALSMLDRGGHLPETRKNDGSIPTGPTRNYEESVAGLTTKQLMERLGFAPPEDE